MGLSEEELKKLEEKIKTNAENWRQRQHNRLKITLNLCQNNKEECLSKIVSTMNKLEILQNLYKELSESELKAQDNLREFIGSREINVKDF